MEPAPARPPPRAVDTLSCLLAYHGPGRELVARLKYRNARATVAWLALGMAQRAGRAGAEGVDTVTWVPTSARRRRRRGFDQAELLARAFARRLDLPCRPLLRRRPGPAQTGLPLAARRAGPHLQARGPVPARVMVVDDVVTSGATLTAAAAALRAAGAHEVHAVTAASTPLQRTLKDVPVPTDATLRGDRRAT